MKTSPTGHGSAQRQIRLTDGVETWIIRVGVIGKQRGLIIARESARGEQVVLFETAGDKWLHGGPVPTK